MNPKATARAVAAKLDPDWTNQWMSHNWTHDLALAALREGWVISNCSGSEYGRWQIQRRDEQDDDSFTQLKDDLDAWKIVMNGHSEHHKIARWFIRDANRPHYSEMMRTTRDKTWNWHKPVSP